jgi:hypothetical protein
MLWTDKRFDACKCPAPPGGTLPIRFALSRLVYQALVA